MKHLDNHKYQPIGRCIYCGSSEDLTLEHIFPEGLSGTAKLPDSSCKQCASITGNFEQKVLRGPLWAVRVYRELRSKRKHKDAPKSYPLTVIRNGQEQEIKLPLESFPILLHFPIFPPPAYLYPEGYEKGIRLNGVTTISFGQDPKQTMEKLGAEKISITQSQEPVAFARMIAKIAYAWAIAEGKLNLMSGSSFVVPAILGVTDDIGRWVGTLTEPLQNYENHLHRILIHEDREKQLVIAEVHLFSDSQTPRYGVILGKL